jgi:hypothetical protein
MTKTEQEQLIISLTQNLQSDLLKKVDKMPENWDGHEIRRFVLDYFQTNYVIGTALNGKRKREYNNTIIVENLL